MELDYANMTDWELATILMKAGDEMERRRGGRNLVGRLTTLVTQVAASGGTVEQFNSAVEYAKASADKSVGRPTPTAAPSTTLPSAPVAEKTPAVVKPKTPTV